MLIAEASGKERSLFAVTNSPVIGMDVPAIRGPEAQPARNSRTKLQTNFMLKMESKAYTSATIDRIVIRFERTGARRANIEIIQICRDVGIQHIRDVGKTEVDPPFVPVVTIKFPGTYEKLRMVAISARTSGVILID